jgi:hypothetical protein
VTLRALAASPLGFVIGISLGALGGGGSILAVPALVYGAGQSPRAATTSSLVLVGLAALVGLGPHLRAARVRPAIGVAFGLAGIPGSVAGTALNHHLDPDLLLLGFSGLVLVAAWRMTTGCPTCTAVGEASALAVPGAVALATRVDRRRLAAVAAAGAGVGFLTGLFGVGGGFVIVPALTLLLGLDMPSAIGTSLVVIAINAVVGVLARVGTTGVEWAITLPFAVSAVGGVLAGGRIAQTIDPRSAVRGFSALLVGVAVLTAAGAVLG